MPRTVPTDEFVSPAAVFRPATDKQIKYVADLLRQKDHQSLLPGRNSKPLTLPLPDPLSAELASQLIAWLRDRPVKLEVVPDAPKASQRALTEGCWIDGEFHYLVLPTKNGRGWNVKLWVPDISDPAGEAGDWVYQGGMATLPAQAHLATLEEATLFAGKFGRCCMCGREIHVRSSRDAGMGPTCAGKTA